MGGPGKVDGKRCIATDNFQPVKFVVNGKEYPSAENYFQCIKCLHENEHEHIRLNGGTGADAWSAGQSVTIVCFNNELF
jgi:predicted NAD-dependent protein-ADP-ribosyltransferase YbiA (DUF1768 family)